MDQSPKSSSSPYRTSSEPIIPPATVRERFYAWWFDNKIHLKDSGMSIAAWVIALTAAGGMSVLLACALQWIVTGFAGHPVGHLQHYIAAVWFYFIVKAIVSSNKKN